MIVLPGVILLGRNSPVDHYVSVYACNLYGVAMFASSCWLIHAKQAKRWRVVSWTLAVALQIVCVIWIINLRA